jgi:hypothetical protein
MPGGRHHDCYSVYHIGEEKREREGEGGRGERGREKRREGERKREGDEDSHTVRSRSCWIGPVASVKRSILTDPIAILGEKKGGKAERKERGKGERESESEEEEREREIGE